ncbi:hypothetical protein DN062_03600 [Nitrincola tibetensis]|uniref:Zorya protein ZorC EH domain-containing protein n=1 Tax=Nitrincola tibetensis TaxID=2219697 RepID=A0A364NQK9_9GAMM|nr:EH signature domain-containing protein [Nitrincola tibetensis]RAU19356.1 hypothetical protein DN062_03600 [Nitrincola tibetensis]
MNMSSMGIGFKTPAEKKPKKMQALVKGMEVHDWNTLDSVNAFPPKSIDQILLLLNEGKASDITILEWIHLFESSNIWSENNTELRTSHTCFKILNAMSENDPLLNLSLFRAALTIDGVGNLFPSLLLDQIHFLDDKLSGWKKEILDIVIKSRDGNYKDIALSVAMQDISVNEFFSKYRLPRCTRLKHAVTASIPYTCETIDLVSYAGWCIYMVKESEHVISVEILNVLLAKRFNDIKNNKYLISKFIEICHPQNEDGYWYDLSEPAQLSLKNIVSISDLYYFKKLVELIFRSKELSVDENSTKQIKRRSQFWCHYESRILSVRILVPEYTYDKVIGLLKSCSWLELLSDKEGSEVIILEFDSVIVLEVLRGEASEIRVFEKNSRNKNILLKSVNPSLNDFRKAHQDAVHDHVICWQWACESWLRKSYNIIPDDKTKKFNGLPPSFSDYDPRKGLPTPDKNMLSLRAEEVARWSDAFFRREMLLGKYTSDGSEAKAHELLLLGQQFNQMGDFKQMVEHWESSAKLGNRAAMMNLAEYYLVKAKSRAELRMRGDVWLRKAAELGDLRANALLGLTV